LESADVSVLSVEALDSLLLSESISVGSEDSLLRIILNIGSGYRDLLRHIHFGFLSENGFPILDEHFGIPPESVWDSAVEQITHLPFPNSQIISDFPEIFAVFRGKHFELLWRGSGDGFKTQEFHRRCDGHSNTLTVILDTKGNIFGGFTPVEWESRVHNGKFERDDNCLKADDSLKSFLFTLKNPHNIAARRFALKAEKKYQAIVCRSKECPWFGCYTCDIRISDNCNANTKSYTQLGTTYTNDTGLDNDIVFTGSGDFKVTEIEVFEITA
jgi:hypothetical protein